MPGFLSQNIKITKVKDHSTAATSDVNSDSIDMEANGGFENVMFLTSYGSPAANNMIHAESSSDNGAADSFADIAGSEVDLGGTSDEDQYIDIQHPPERYVRCVGVRGTSSTLESIWAVQYNGRTRPQTQDITGTIYGKRIADPAVGTK
jgi:hypothetical protein